MKVLLLLGFLAAFLLLLPLPLHTEETDKPGPIPPSPPAKWNVQIEALLVSLPQDKALSLLPALRDDAKIEGAYQELVALVQHGEARLIDCPVLLMHENQQATSETILGVVYPTAIALPTEPQNMGGLGTPHRAEEHFPLEVNFEKRNAGVTLQLEPVVSPDAQWIKLRAVIGHVALVGTDTYESFEANNGLPIKMDQPLLSDLRVSTTVTFRNGQRLLAGVHTATKPEGLTELWLLKTMALPITADAPTGATRPAHWGVRVEDDLIVLPQAKALALLPDLCDGAKTEAARRELDELILHKEATLVAGPLLTADAGVEGESDDILGKNYPSGYAVMPLTPEARAAAPTLSAQANTLMVANFEKRNLGVSLSAEADVLPGGEWIDLNASPKRVAYLGNSSYALVQKSIGLDTVVEQPRFFTTQTAASFAVQTGRWVLVGAHKLTQPEGTVELNLLRATASPVPSILMPPPDFRNFDDPPGAAKSPK